MCNKQNLLKHFFVVVNHPPPLTRPLVLGVIRQTQHTKNLYEKCRNGTLSKQEIEDLGLKAPPIVNPYLLSIQIPRDWFIY
jgi:hypothetical protein